jgi:hypothetical protein
MKAAARAVVLAALPFWATGSAAADSPKDPVLEAANPGASARRNHFLPWHPVRPGQRLSADMELMCERGCTVRTVDGSTVSLAADAHITVGQLTFVPIGAPQAALGRRFELRAGSLSVSVSKDGVRPHTVLIGGPDDVVAVLRPGQSQVVISPERFAVACVTGSARVKLRKTTSLDLRAGQATSTGPGLPSLSAKPLGSPPHIRSAQGKLGELQPLAIALDAAGGRAGLEWDPVPGSSGYEIDIAGDPRFGSLTEVGRIDAASTGYLARNLPPGTYYGRVIAFDEAGLASLPSEPATLHVVALTPPPGAVVNSARASVVAAVGTTVQLSESQSLEMAGEGEQFSPAPSDIPVEREPRIVRLRRKGDFGHETRLRLEPRGIRAEIRLTPFWARWPDDAVDVSVTLRDPTGLANVKEMTPELEVLVGLEPVLLQWTRDGAIFRATLAPRAPAGPAVVRVIAKDRDGSLLGRNFLEIEPTEPTGILARRTPLAHR